MTLLYHIIIQSFFIYKIWNVSAFLRNQQCSFTLYNTYPKSTNIYYGCLSGDELIVYIYLLILNVIKSPERMVQPV